MSTAVATKETTPITPAPSRPTSRCRTRTRKISSSPTTRARRPLFYSSTRFDWCRLHQENACFTSALALLQVAEVAASRSTRLSHRPGKEKMASAPALADMHRKVTRTTGLFHAGVQHQQRRTGHHR